MDPTIIYLILGITVQSIIYYFCFWSCCFKKKNASKYFFICFPIAWPFYLIYLLFKKVIWMPRKKSRPPKLLETLAKPPNISFRAFNCLLSCLFHMSPITFSFAKSLTAKEVILRYSEQKLMTANELHEKLKEDKFLDLILNLLNGQNCRFFFKILLSGSLRERYGRPLPSTSILGSDYDLMLIPDGVEVVESSQINTSSSGRVAPLFEAISDPNQNPETPNGYVWLKLLDPGLKNWKNLCFDRITSNGG